jgi:Holliday junction resolvase
MAHRTKKGQEVHDQKVAEVANRLERAGYTVRADLPGHSQPPVLGGHRPDVVAQKREKILIREIETHGTIKQDKAQHEALEQAADRLGGNFRVLVAKKK